MGFAGAARIFASSVIAMIGTASGSPEGFAPEVRASFTISAPTPSASMGRKYGRVKGMSEPMVTGTLSATNPL